MYLSTISDLDCNQTVTGYGISKQLNMIFWVYLKLGCTS